jgi:hypothetical protein
VLGPDGSPVAGAQVVAVRNTSQPDIISELFSDSVTGWSTEARTGASGRAVLEGLDPETSYVLGMRGPSAAGFADAIEPLWSPAVATVRLAAGLSLSGVARGAAGILLHGTYVDFLEANGVSRTVVTGKDGGFSLTGLAAGAARLEARLEDNQAKRNPRSLRAGATVRAGTESVDLRLR